MAAPRLSVVIPAYDEERRLGRSLPAVLEHMHRRSPGEAGAFEVVVVDDGSRDGTSALVEDLARKEPSLRLLAFSRNRGKGAALRAGLLAARGDRVLFTDADLSTPLDELARLEATLDRGFGLVCGSRAAPGARVERDQGRLRAAAGRLFGLGTRLVAVRGVRDTQCGFKLLRRVVARALVPRVTTDTALFDLELLLVAARAGVPVAEVPVRWTHDPETRIPYGPGSAIDVWRELFRIRRAHRVGWPPRVRTRPAAEV